LLTAATSARSSAAAGADLLSTAASAGSRPFARAQLLATTSGARPHAATGKIACTRPRAGTGACSSGIVSQEIVGGVAGDGAGGAAGEGSGTVERCAATAAKIQEVVELSLTRSAAWSCAAAGPSAAAC
jgi:hypothetical protein